MVHKSHLFTNQTSRLMLCSLTRDGNTVMRSKFKFCKQNTVVSIGKVRNIGFWCDFHNILQYFDQQNTVCFDFCVTAVRQQSFFTSEIFLIFCKCNLTLTRRRLTKPPMNAILISNYCHICDKIICTLELFFCNVKYCQIALAGGLSHVVNVLWLAPLIIFSTGVSED